MYLQQHQVKHLQWLTVCQCRPLHPCHPYDEVRDVRRSVYYYFILFIFYPHTPIGNVWIYRLLFFVILCVCTVTDFSAEDKASGVKFCMAVHRRDTVVTGHRFPCWMLYAGQGKSSDVKVQTLKTFSVFMSSVAYLHTELIPLISSTESFFQGPH